MKNVMIRPATQADAQEMLALYAPYVLHTTVTSEYDPPSLEEFVGRIRTYTAKTPWLCCVVDGQIVGYGVCVSAPHTRCVSVVVRDVYLYQNGISSARHCNGALFGIV